MKKKPRARKTRLKKSRPVLPSVEPIFLPEHPNDCLCPFHSPPAREWSAEFKSFAGLLVFLGLAVTVLLQVMIWKEDEYAAKLEAAAKSCDLVRGDRDAYCFEDGDVARRWHLEKFAEEPESWRNF